MTVVAGCGDDGDDHPATAASSAPMAEGETETPAVDVRTELEAGRFVATVWIVDGEPADNPDPMWIDFEFSRLSAAATCNAFTAYYTVPDGRIVLGQVTQDLGGCNLGGGPILELLQASPVVQLDGDRLVLDTDDQHAELERMSDPVS
jgi:heat shock protein HslJ